ncbi:MAG: T9SS type A sorting domain-containing protein [Bacteroidales bacterium]|nr:T9SS type A sorting domain-containing protein [Bacteroidales bacterium]
MKTVKIIILIVAGVILSCCNLLPAQTPYNVIEDTLRRNAFGVLGPCFFNFSDSDVEGIYFNGAGCLYKLDSNLNVVRNFDIRPVLERSYNSYFYPIGYIDDKYYAIRNETVLVDENNNPINPYLDIYFFVADMKTRVVKEKLLFTRADTSLYVAGMNKNNATFYFERGNQWLILDTLGNRVNKNTLYMPGKIYSTEGYGGWMIENHEEHIDGQPDDDQFFYSTGITLVPVDIDSMNVRYDDSVRFDVPYMWISALNRTISLLHQLDDTTMITIVDSIKYGGNSNYNQLCDVVLNVLNLNTGQRDARIVLAEIPWYSGVAGRVRTVSCSASGIAYENRDSIYMCFIGMSDVYDTIIHSSLYITCFNPNGTVHFVKPYQLDFVRNSTKLYTLKVLNGNLYIWIDASVLKYSPKGMVVDTSGAVNPDDSGSLTDVTAEMTTVIYPNPAKDRLNISSLKKMDRIEIINLTGQCVYSSKANSNSVTINTENIESGQYFVKIYFDKELLTKKFLIQ